MKTKSFKSYLLYALLAFGMVFSFSACSDDDDNEDNGPKVLDGMYIKGAGTALTDLVSNGRMSVAKNEVLQEDRETLFEMYIAIKAGSEGFNIVEVEGAVTKTYGPGADFAVVLEADRDVEEPKLDFQRGSLVETTNKFTVPADGLYHVSFDKELMKVAVVPVNWGVIGGATPGGWSSSTALTSSAFNLNKMSFEIAEITMLKNNWKFRYSDGWKVILDANLDLGSGKKGVKVNCNFGGTIDALEAGGADIANATYGVYKINITWELGVGTKATSTWVKDGEPLPEYPAELYMIGGSIGGWDWIANGIQMVPVHSNPHVFWRIVWIEKGATDPGVKFNSVKAWGTDFGVNEAEGATNGVWKKGSNNLPEVAASGYYMVVVNLKTETVEVNVPKVYGLGDAFGSWDAAQAATLFTVNNTDKVLVSTPATTAGNLRMHTAATTLTKEDGNPVPWWQAEFNVIDSKIEYRGTGGDQASVPVTAGQKATLNFSTGAGSIQ
jgi:hypothetical protein